METKTYDSLIVDASSIETKEVTIVIGGGPLSRGSLLGKIIAGAATGGAVVGTGNGTIGTITRGKKVKVGNYVATCIQVVTNGGLFQVKNPLNEIVGIARVGVAFASPEINFTIADGGTDFALGDAFTIAVAAGSGHYQLADQDAVDGSANADCVLAEDVAANAGAAKAHVPVYTSGVFNRNSMIFASGETYATYEEELRKLNIIMKDSVQA